MKRLNRGAFAALLLLALPAAADDACKGFKWDVAREHALFLGTATAAQAGTGADDTPAMALSTLYDLALSPQEQVRYPAPASKKMLADGAYGGLMRVRVAAAGAYRVSVDVPFWLDIANAGKTIASVDFNGAPGCDKPRKIVVYDLPADTDLVLQFSGAVDEHVHVTLTPVATPGA